LRGLYTNIDDGGERAHYDDIAYSKGKFYAVDIMGLVISVDASTLKTKKGASHASLLVQTWWTIQVFGEVPRGVVHGGQVL
jgi:hypothetical protein